MKKLITSLFVTLGAIRDEYTRDYKESGGIRKELFRDPKQEALAAKFAKFDAMNARIATANGQPAPRPIAGW